VKRRRHTPEQVIRKLREAERKLAEGNLTAEAAKAWLESERLRTSASGSGSPHPTSAVDGHTKRS